VKAASLYRAVAVVNLMVAVSYRVLLDVPFPPLERLLAILAISSLAVVIVQRWPEARTARFLGDTQVALLTIFALLLGLEGVWRLAPGLFPGWVRDRVQERNVDSVRREVVEYLDSSPFVKFRANTLVRSQGFRGTEAEFAYEWGTDRRGFKNLPEVAALDQVEIVAVGDSFTEGMGVKTEEVWPTLLTRAAHPTYNLGVQGFAPIQLAGAFRRYGVSLKPRIVLIGYCEGMFAREEAFQDLEAARRGRRFTGAIQQFVDQEIRQQRRFVTTMLVEAGYFWFASGVTAFKDLFRPHGPPAPLAFPIDPAFQRYATEIAYVAGSPVRSLPIRERRKAWRDTLDAFLDIRDRGRAVGARTVLLYLPGRGAMYYERATGRPLPQEAFVRLEASALEQFAAANEMAFVDTSSRILRHVASLDARAPQGEYPYLKLDGHMSPRGHALVAEVVLTALGAASTPISR